MTSIRTERESMSPAEQGAFERRVARAYQEGVGYEDMRRRFRLSHDAILAIIKKFPSIKLRQPKRSRPAQRKKSA